jgi:hypothetical protein
MSKVKSKYYLIADIHFSKSKEIEGFKRPMEEFIENIKADTFNGEKRVIIAGDYFDTLLSPQDEAYRLGAKFLRELEDISDKLYILYGTMSHDRENYNVLESFLADTTEMIKMPRVIDDILFLPENYPENWEEFYEPWLGEGKKYEMIVGHGMITGGSMGVIKIQDEIDNKRLGTKHFNPDTLSECAKQVFFGHIHIGQDIRHNVRYIGSMNRLRYGDETPKGFWTYEDENINFTELATCLRFDTITYEEYKEKPEVVDSLSESRKVRVLINSDLSAETKKELKKDGFAIKDNKSAREVREAKSLNKLKHDEVSSEMPYKEAIQKIMEADDKASKKLKEQITCELENNVLK